MRHGVHEEKFLASGGPRPTRDHGRCGHLIEYSKPPTALLDAEKPTRKEKESLV
jgi:hypothetical protein